MKRFLPLARLALACSGAAGLLLAGPASAFAMTQTFRTPIDMVVTNNCNGDVIEYIGTAQVVETTGPSNSPESQFRVIYSGLKGTGLSGESYILSGQAAFMSAGQPGTAATVVIQMTVLQQTSLGPDQNDHLMITMQIVFDSQGNVVETHGTATETCNG